MSGELRLPLLSHPEAGLEEGETLSAPPDRTLFLCESLPEPQSQPAQLRRHPGSALFVPVPTEGAGGPQELPSWDTPAPTFGRELRRLRAEVPEADGGVSRAARQVPGRGGKAQLRAVSLGRGRTAVAASPQAPPEAGPSYFPVGLKATEMTASVCPSRELVHRVTARTLNTACGW